MQNHPPDGDDGKRNIDTNRRYNSYFDVDGFDTIQCECLIRNCVALKEISIVHMAFNKCHYFSMIGLNNLESIQFGRNSFQYVNKVKFEGR